LALHGCRKRLLVADNLYRMIIQLDPIKDRSEPFFPRTVVSSRRG
jgi:hypothetical protein